MTIYRKAYILAGLTLALALFSGCTDSELVRAMADFDRAYVPALSLTSDSGKGAEAVMAVKRLNQNWGVLEIRARSLGVTNDELEAIASRIREADGLVMIRAYDRAHAQILEAGPMMRAIRQRYGIPYYLDYLAAYDESMRKVETELSARGRINHDRVTRSLALATSALDRLREQKLNAQTFWLTRKTKKDIIEQLSAEQELLTRLTRELKDMNMLAFSEEMKKSAKRRQDIYRTFGNFSWSEL